LQKLFTVHYCRHYLIQNIVSTVCASTDILLYFTDGIGLHDCIYVPEFNKKPSYSKVWPTVLPH